MNKSTLIPTATAISVLTTVAGCSDPAVGTWDLASVTQDGETTAFPIDETYTGEGYTVIVRGSIDMTLEKDGTGVFNQEFYQSYNGQGDTANYTYPLVGTKMAKGQWDITITGDDDTIDLSCTADGESMSCDDGDGASLTWALRP
ncbi:MAG: hypothetical protein H6734_06010 [Alphaproteobacteria bacterium]|nr:hypothetical protein [Alphaproteobacteria bacterium]